MNELQQSAGRVRVITGRGSGMCKGPVLSGNLMMPGENAKGGERERDVQRHCCSGRART